MIHKTVNFRPILASFVGEFQRTRIKTENQAMKKPSGFAKNGANRLDSRGKWRILSQFFKFEKNCVKKSVKYRVFR